MVNAISEGKVMEYSNAGSAISSGDVVSVGAGVGVAVVDIDASTGKGSVSMEGVFSLAKEAPLAIAQGAKVYWDASASKVTTTALANKPIGYAHVAGASADTTLEVKLVPVAVGQATVIAALGATANLVGVDGTGSNAAPLVGTEARLDAIEAKIDATLAALKAAGLMANA